MLKGGLNWSGQGKGRSPVGCPLYMLNAKMPSRTSARTVNPEGELLLLNQSKGFAVRLVGEYRFVCRTRAGTPFSRPGRK
jgi:hypothetical protein